MINSQFFLTATSPYLCQYLGNTFPSFVVLFSVIIQCVLLLSWSHWTCHSFYQSFLSTFWQSCCVTALTNCSSHSEEPAFPLSVPGIRGTLSTLRFSLRDVSQQQQKRACPNTGCGPLCGELIGLFTASHHVNASSEFQFVWWLQSNILLLSTCFLVLALTGLTWMTGMMCHCRHGHCLRSH